MPPSLTELLPWCNSGNTLPILQIKKYTHTHWNFWVFYNKIQILSIWKAYIMMYYPMHQEILLCCHLATCFPIFLSKITDFTKESGTMWCNQNKYHILLQKQYQTEVYPLEFYCRTVTVSECIISASPVFLILSSMPHTNFQIYNGSSLTMLVN
jgi:hypothetical protein